MIWVIGDVHGMIDPLGRILTEIGLLERETKEPVEKLIFVGDLIDHGPSSKGVLDLLLNPPWPVVALMGNHEDLAVRTCMPDPVFLGDYPNAWIDNGAYETCVSLADRPGPKLRALRRRLASRPEPGAPVSETRIGIPAKYYRFLRDLPCSHQETLGVGGRRVRFVFSHALHSPALDLDEQLASDHDDFNRRLPALRRALAGEEKPDQPRPELHHLESSILWNRKYDFDRGYGGAVVVHGHTPTPWYTRLYHPVGDTEERLWLQFFDFPEKSLAPFLFSRSEGAVLSGERYGRGDTWARDGHLDYKTRDALGVEAINVDTGAAAGGSLTALGLSPKLLSDGFLATLSCLTGGNIRLTRPKVDRRTIRFERLGGPEVSLKAKPGAGPRNRGAKPGRKPARKA